MPVSETPIIASKVPLVSDEEEKNSYWEIDPTQWQELGRQASREAQAALHRKGLSYFIGRDGLVIEVLPSGEERVSESPRE